MPARPPAAGNRRWVAWLNQGLKRPHWSARRVAQMALLIALGVIVAALYLTQSSQIVASTRQVQALRDELAELRQENADLVLTISGLTKRAQLEQRAIALGFRAAAQVLFVRVPRMPVDDTPSLVNVYAPAPIDAPARPAVR
jgi:cell division protein FtsB